PRASSPRQSTMPSHDRCVSADQECAECACRVLTLPLRREPRSGVCGAAPIVAQVLRPRADGGRTSTSRPAGALMARTLPMADGMSQKSVEIVIGRLATDEALRGQFVRDPKATLRQMSDSGLDLNLGETEALLEMPVAFLRVLANWVHPRLQKIALSSRD